MGNNRYIVAWVHFRPIPSYGTRAIDSIAMREWVRSYLAIVKDKSIEVKTHSEAKAYLDMLSNNDCKFAFIYDKSNRELISYKEF